MYIFAECVSILKKKTHVYLFMYTEEEISFVFSFRMILLMIS